MLESILARLLTDDGSALQVLGRDMDLSYRRLGAGVAQVLRLLERHRGAGGGAGLRVGLFMPDGPEWVCADLALMLGGHRSIPIPLEFSPAQAFALLREADVCLTVPEVVEAPHLARFPSRLRLELRDEWLFAQDNPGLEVGVPTGLDPDATRLVKAIHTSGTTDQPKGVLLSYGAISSKVETLTRLIGVSHLRRYLSLVPLSLLLEQICGIYLTLSCGGTLVLLPPEEGPLTGGGPSVEPYLRRLAEALPTFTVLPPVLVEAMHSFAAERPRMDSRELSRNLFGQSVPPLLACGGAPVAVSTLGYLASRGIIVHEGYGLSECASVVSWNLPGQVKAGTVGRPLPDCEVRLAEDGELLVRGPSLFKGYQGTDPGSCGIRPDGFLETGDLADIDEDGYIRILGRKKNILITSTGRNLSAEWIEGVLAGKPEIRAAVVFGDGGPFPVGIVIPRPGCPPADVLRAVRAANGELPVFARVRNLAMPRMGAGELRRYFTITGRPRREQLLKDFSETLAGLTRSMHPDLVRDQS